MATGLKCWDMMAQASMCEMVQKGSWQTQQGWEMGTLPRAEPAQTHQHEAITGHCFGEGLGTALGPCQALGKPWDEVCVSRTCWDRAALWLGMLTGQELTTRQMPGGWEM